MCVRHEPRRKIAAVRASRNPVFAIAPRGILPPTFFGGGLQRYNRVGSFGGDLIDLTTRPHMYVLWYLDTCIVHASDFAQGANIGP